MLMAHAARNTLVTVEEIATATCWPTTGYAAGTIPALYVSARRRGPARRLAGRPARRYPADVGHLRHYAEEARTEEGFPRYLEAFVLDAHRRRNERAIVRKSC